MAKMNSVVVSRRRADEHFIIISPLVSNLRATNAISFVLVQNVVAFVASLIVFPVKREELFVNGI